jgi:hypothetical protein
MTLMFLIMDSFPPWLALLSHSERQLTQPLLYGLLSPFQNSHSEACTKQVVLFTSFL